MANNIPPPLAPILRRSPATYRGSDEDQIDRYITSVIGDNIAIPSEEVIKRTWGSFKDFYDTRSLVNPNHIVNYKTINNIYKNPNLYFRPVKKSSKKAKKSPKSPKKVKKSKK